MTRCSSYFRLETGHRQLLVPRCLRGDEFDGSSGSGIFSEVAGMDVSYSFNRKLGGMPCAQRQIPIRVEFNDNRFLTGRRVTPPYGVRLYICPQHLS